ncbi:spermatogenesis-associated protein 4 isoform 2-T2 [Synchiropus picturatus]
MPYARCANIYGLPREVVQWLQGLNLAAYPGNVRRDFSNGFLVAEMLSFYYPTYFQMYQYKNESSVAAKQWNWNKIKQEVVEGTIHCKPGAAELMVQQLYSILTKNSTSELQSPNLDFTDRKYQEQLPYVARSTAIMSVRNNLTNSEMLANPDKRTNQRKAETILDRHQKNKAADKVLFPERFKLKPHLQKAVLKNVERPKREEKSPLYCSPPGVVATSRVTTTTTKEADPGASQPKCPKRASPVLTAAQPGTLKASPKPDEPCTSSVFWVHPGAAYQLDVHIKPITAGPWEDPYHKPELPLVTAFDVKEKQLYSKLLLHHNAPGQCCVTRWQHLPTCSTPDLAARQSFTVCIPRNHQPSARC